MKKYLLDFNDYKTYLNAALDQPPYGGRGARSRLARHLGTQTAFVAQVLKGAQHFSPEHAEKISRFFNHSETEKMFFFFLLQKGRAGTKELKDFMDTQMKKIKEDLEEVKSRLKIENELSVADLHQFYGSWIHIAVHVLLGIPRYRDPRTIANTLKIETAEVQESINFMLRCGLLTRQGHHYKLGHRRTHLGSKSPLLKLHHHNWRLQAMKSIDRLNEKDLHFSSLFSMSEKDAVEIREEIMQLLERFHKKLANSPDETTRALNFDFFSLNH